ncbi:DUF3106 domain-containing protein [Mycetocola reblochoni]|uniref:Expressed protein n=1 Tax=Mycetocola reblochoni REB411 TaxID=1255698 RepID=A0A1R4KE31_9MICO|nr:DUF3106 domain-containing protein [Mycetocola reblochoni]SJN42384.1 expressed protein [Mycetocola reblochoni REB411]
MSTFRRLLKTVTDNLGDSSRTGSAAGSRGSAAGGTDWKAIAGGLAERFLGDGSTGSADGRAEAAPRQSGAPVQGSADGRSTGGSAVPAGSASGNAAGQGPAATSEDAAAIARYDYLVRTAPPEQLERVNEEAFARLTPAQREQLRARLDEELPAAERPSSAEPSTLARSATRGEVTRPGLLQRVLGGSGSGAGPADGSAQGAASGRSGGPGWGGALAGAGIGVVGGGLLAAVAGGAVLSAAAGPLLAGVSGLGEQLGGGLDGLGEGLGGAVEGVTGGLGESIGAAGESITGGLSEGLGQAGDGLGQVADSVSGFGLDDVIGGFFE